MSSSTASALSVREYLSTVYEPDYDYVDGVLEDRHVGEISHSKLQFRLLTLLSRNPALFVFPECRLQVSSTRFRVPDISIYLQDQEGQILTEPPHIVIEILPPEDRLLQFLQKTKDYFQLGCSNVWVFDPKMSLMYKCTEVGLGLPVEVLQADSVSLAAFDLGW